MKKYLKRCEDFVLCGASGDNGEILIDGYPDNYAIYHIVVRGVGKMGALFESGYINLDQYENNFVDTKKYLYSKRIYVPSEPFKIFGFNALEPEIDWSGRIIKDSFQGDENSWLICFSGEPIINDVKVLPLDYVKLKNKHYNVKINDGIVGLFTKL